MFGSDALARKPNFVTIKSVDNVLLGSLAVIWSWHWQGICKVASDLSKRSRMFD